jgi:hypothetical protein
MASSRRNVLTMLGLAPLGTPAIASCDITRTDFDGNGTVSYRVARYDPERMAVALERLAAEIRANTVHVPRFHIGSEAVSPEPDWLKQTLTIDLEIKHPEKPDA